MTHSSNKLKVEKKEVPRGYVYETYYKTSVKDYPLVQPYADFFKGEQANIGQFPDGKTAMDYAEKFMQAVKTNKMEALKLAS
jgi:hypothetical protein